MRLGPLVALLVLAGCGSRSPILTARADGSGGLPDQAIQPPDHGRIADLPTCLPAPESDVLGKYQAGWNGVWTCPGGVSINIAGDIVFEMTRGSSLQAYNMKGIMFGIPPSPVFSGNVSGTMTCRTLSATVPTIALGGGVQATGSLSAEFAWVSQYVGWGFPKGTWKATEIGGSCTASGTWEAARY